MNKKKLVGYRFAALFITLAVVAGAFAARSTLAQAQEGYLALERTIDVTKLGLSKLDRAGYSESTGSFILVDGPRAFTMDTFERNTGVGKIDAANMDVELLALQGQAASSYNLDGLSLSSSRGVAVDAASGRLYVLDASGRQVVATAKDSAQSEQFALNISDKIELRGIAFNPQTNSLFALSPQDLKVYEFDLSGNLLSMRNLAAQGIKSASSILVAPSGDLTDSDAEMSLYVAGDATLAEFSLTEPTVNAITADLPISLVNSFPTSTWNPPSTDPTGILYLTQMNQFMVADSDVDQTPLYEGVDIFFTNDQGNLSDTCSLDTITTEPTGLAYLASTNTVYISDDDKDAIHRLNIGADGMPCTGDDTPGASIDMTQYGSNDATGLTIVDGLLYVSDGLNFEVYVIDPNNGNLVRQFDISNVDARGGQAQGIEYYPSRNSLILVTRSDGFIFEMDGNGNLLNRFNVRDFVMDGNSGVGIGPRSTDSSQLSLYVTARGGDIVHEPANYNDGMVYEYAIENAPPAPPLDNFLFLPLITR